MIQDYFQEITDTRDERGKRHKLLDIITIAICGVICGCDDWIEIAAYGKAKKEWFKTFLELPHGIPSHDTFGRVFAQINPREFELGFIEWIQAIQDKTESDVIAIDGKTVRHSYSTEDNRAAIHMVSAWSNANGIVLGQVKTSEKSNEITAIPKLLEILDIRGCIVTIDAMGCQKAIASKILEKGADYVLALKGNQGSLEEDVSLYFQDALKNHFKDMPHDYYQTIGKDHGRIETRQHWITSDVDWLNKRHQWEGLRSIGMVLSERDIKGVVSKEFRYYICSIDQDAKKFGTAVRAHWGIENSLHWLLDVAFREDESRIRKDHGPENFSVLRRVALNALKKNQTRKKGSIKVKRLVAGWDNVFLYDLLCHEVIGA